MKTKLALRRILALVLVVVFLTFVYFMVRAGYAVSIDHMENQASSAQGVPMAVQTSAPKSGWLVLEDTGDTVSVKLRESVDFALGCLGYASQYAESISSKQLEGASEGVIVTATELGNLGNTTLLLDYARDGGIVVFAVRPEVDDAFRSIYQQLGIYEHAFSKWSEGFHLRAGMLTEEALDIEGKWLDNSIIELHVSDACEVYAENDDGVPLIWSVGYGQGDILVMNNSLMTLKSSGGLLISILAEIRGPMVWPVVNARVFALESFPLPNDVNREYIREVYLRSGQAFLRDVWWPAMVRFSQTKDVPITAGLLTGYESEEAYSSYSIVNEDVNLVFYTKELARYGGEVGLTGFNQKPLYFKPLAKNMTFTPWSGASLAVQRTEEAIDFFAWYLPSYTLSAYLPPERLLDEQGYEMIRQIMPGLQVVCGDFDGRDLWYQDFGVGEDGVARFPVVSRGFAPSATDEWNLLCVANALGVVFHSCDVSDLLLESDPDNSWNTLSESFFTFSEKCFSQTDHLDGQTVTEASWRMREMLSLGAEIRVTENAVSVLVPPDNMPKEASFMLLCPGKKPKEIPQVTCTPISEGRYLVSSSIPQFTLELVGV